MTESEVAPSAIPTLRQKILRVSTDERLRVLTAIDAKLSEDALHANVRTGLTALRSSVTTVDQTKAAAAEMATEVPALWKKGASTAERGRALAWLAAAGAGAAGVFSLLKGGFKRFLAFMAIPATALMARAWGSDPFYQVGRRPYVPPESVPQEEDGSIGFTESLSENMNLMNILLRYRDSAGTEYKLRPTSPESGLRLEYGGRQFGVFGFANQQQTQIEPMTGFDQIFRNRDGSVSLRMNHMIGRVSVATVMMNIDSGSFGELASGLSRSGDEIRPVTLNFRTTVAQMGGLATVNAVKTELEKTGITPTISPDGRTMTWQARAFLRPLSGEELTDTRRIRRYPAPGLPPSPQT